MAKKPFRSKPPRPLSGETGPEDGLDPRHYFGPDPGRPKPNRKALQLCGQVARTLGDVLAGELDDDVLRNLQVVAVEPAPDESRLLVTVGPFAPGIALDPPRVMAHLSAASARLRSEVASAITRKRAPTLIYQLAGPASFGEGTA